MLQSQSLALIEEAFPVYGQAVVSEFAKTFWEAISVEVSDPLQFKMELKRFLTGLSCHRCGFRSVGAQSYASFLGDFVPRRGGV